MGTSFGVPEDSKFTQAVEQWLEISDVEQSQLEALSVIFSRADDDGIGGEGKRQSVKTIASVLDRVDDLANLVVGAEPRLAPLARWLSTEKSRLGPQAQADLVQKYREINLQLRTVLLRIKEAGEAHDRFELGL
jgi:hypothetical protein